MQTHTHTCMQTHTYVCMFAKFDRREFKVIKSNKLTTTIRYMCVCLILKQGASQNEMCNNAKWLTYRLTNEWKNEEHKANWRKVDDIDDSLLLFFAVFSALFGHQSICCFNYTFYCSSFSFSHNRYRFAAADFPTCRSVSVVLLLLIATAVICLLLLLLHTHRQTNRHA